MSGDDRIDGGAGDDRLLGGFGHDRETGGAGDDVLEGDEAPDRLDGGAGDDALDGGSGPDVLTGGDGDDHIVGGHRAATRSTRAPGDDVVAINDRGSDASRRLRRRHRHARRRPAEGRAARPTATSSTPAGVVNCEQIVAVEPAAPDPREGILALTADAGDGRLGTPRDDKLLGGSGGDVLDGGAGDDLLWGDRDPGTAAPDVLRGGEGKDTIYGGGGPDAIDGGPGNDVLQGDDGADVIRGGPGNDAIRPGRGADRVFAGPGDDVCAPRPTGAATGSTAVRAATSPTWIAATARPAARSCAAAERRGTRPSHVPRSFVSTPVAAETPTDAALLAATAQDPEAFGVFYRRHVRAVLALLIARTRNTEVAADLCAETFACALEQADRYDAAPRAGARLAVHDGLVAAGGLRSPRAGRGRRAPRLGIPPRALTDRDLERIEELVDVRAGDRHVVLARRPAAPSSARRSWRGWSTSASTATSRRSCRSPTPWCASACRAGWPSCGRGWGRDERGVLPGRAGARPRRRGAPARRRVRDAAAVGDWLRHARGRRRRARSPGGAARRCGRSRSRPRCSSARRRAPPAGRCWRCAGGDPGARRGRRSRSPRRGPRGVASLPRPPIRSAARCRGRSGSRAAARPGCCAPPSGRSTRPRASGSSGWTAASARSPRASATPAAPSTTAASR